MIQSTAVTSLQEELHSGGHRLAFKFKVRIISQITPSLYMYVPYPRTAISQHDCV